MQQNYQKCDVLKITNGMVKTIQHITGGQCIRNDDGLLAVSDEDKKIAWKSYHEKLLNTEFAWNNNSLFQVYKVSSILWLIDKSIIRESISKIKNGKAAGLLGVVLEMVAGVDMILDLVNQIIVEGDIPAEKELFKRKVNSLEIGNYRGLKLTDQILKTAERIIEKLIRQKTDKDEMHFGFMPGWENINITFILTQLHEKYLAKKFAFAISVFLEFKEAFNRDPSDVVWWVLRKLAVEVWLIKIVQSLYRNA